MGTATRFYNNAQGRSAHPGFINVARLYPIGVPQIPDIVQSRWSRMPELQHTQGAFHDPGLCCETPLAFVETRAALEMIYENRYKLSGGEGTMLARKDI